MFTSRAKQTHRQTHCSENITPPQFCGGVKREEGERGKPERKEGKREKQRKRGRKERGREKERKREKEKKERKRERKRKFVFSSHKAGANLQFL